MSRMRQLNRTLVAAFISIASATAWSADAVDYSRPLKGELGAVAKYPIPYTVPSTGGVKAVIDRVGSYVMQNTSLRVFDNKAGVEITNADLANPNPDAVIDSRFTPYNRWDYPNGVTWSAFHRITDITGDQRYTEHAIRVYDWIFTWMPYFREQEKLTGKNTLFSKMIRMTALDHCGAISAGLIRTHIKSPDPRFRAWIDVVTDYISNGQFRLPDGTLARERPQAVSLWTDDFYMGVSFLAQRGRLAGEGKYWDDAIKQITQGSARLFDETKCLYDHGWSENTDGYDPRFYWARANGWAALAMTELLAELPADYPGRDKVLHYFRQLMRGVVEHQDGTGLWHNVLDRPQTYLESSATAMFVYALARGVNEGWLSPIYGPPAITGWNGLATRVLPDGRVEGICEGTTYASEHTYYTYRGAGADTIFVGPVLYAGVEMIRLLGNRSIQVAAPRPNAVNSALLMKAETAESSGEGAKVQAGDWAEAARIVEAIRLPEIPERDYVITDFGAKPGGDSDARPAIHAAIQKAAADGGGRVIIPAGSWNSRGPIHLASRINLHIAEGATVRFSPAARDYLPAVPTRWEGTEMRGYSPLIYAANVHDVAITGKGTFDGNAASEFLTWIPKAEKDMLSLRRSGVDGTPAERRVYAEGTHLRPSMVQFFLAERVLLEDYTLLNSPFWVNHLVYTDHATVRRVRVDSHHANNDGVDVDSSRYVLIEDCWFRTGDDSVVVKSGRDRDGRDAGRPSEFVVVRRNDMGGEDGIALGSEMSGGIRHVYFTDNILRKGASAIRFKANLDRGGTVEHIRVRNFAVESFDNLFWFQLNYPGLLGGGHPATYRDIVFENFTVERAGTVIDARAPAEAPLRDVTLRNVVIKEAERNFILENVEGLKFENVLINGQRVNGQLDSKEPAR